MRKFILIYCIIFFACSSPSMFDNIDVVIKVEKYIRNQDLDLITTDMNTQIVVKRGKYNIGDTLKLK